MSKPNTRNEAVSVSRSTRNGHEITTYRDASGASVTIDSGVKTLGIFRAIGVVVLRDEDESITITANSSGKANKAGTAPVVVAKNNDDSGVIADEDGSLTAGFISNDYYTVACFMNNSNIWVKDSVNVIRDVADSVLRRRAQEFAAQHPALMARAVESTVRVAHFRDAEVTLGQMLAAPANFEACPTSGEVVKRRSR